MTANFNRLGNCKNRYQGHYKKVLCVCSAGLLRSPTAALVLASEPFNYNTRAVGLDSEFALIPLDEVHLDWADEIVVMTKEQSAELSKLTEKPVLCLEIPDQFAYRDPALVEMIVAKYSALSGAPQCP